MPDRSATLPDLGATKPPHDPRYSGARECNLSKREVILFAEDAASRLGYRPGGALEPIVARLRGRIAIVSDLGIRDTQDGSIRVENDGTFTIFLADDVGAARQRFTIAHELGHYFLHWVLADPQVPIKAARYGTGRVEWEANWFASGFLMPEKAFRQALDEQQGDLLEVADAFHVSSQAAEYRAEYLRLDWW